MPSPLGWPDHLLFVVLAVVFPVRTALFGLRPLRRAAETDLPRVKLAVYRRAIVLQWTVVALVAVLWLVTHRSWSALGLVPRLGGGLLGVVAGLAVIVAVLVRQGYLQPADDASLEHVRQRTRHLERMLPTTLRERSWFFALAGTAGVCEEVLYRGYLIWYLVAWTWLFAPHSSFLMAAVASSLLFGAGHAYQGARGILLTAVVGGFLAAVYWITRSLFAGMLIHALMDLHAGYLSELAYARTPGHPETGPQGG
jgi:membrane protease YdiL (CAAX protease family)